MDKLGKYEIVGKIGVGGFGVVYQGYDPFIKRHVAIKTCAAEDPETRERFLREAEIAGNLQHRNIVTVFEFGYQGEVPYLVQEFLSGEDLDHKIRRGDAVPLAEKVAWLVEVASGLEFAHGRGVIHRDVKPANIRILQDGTAKILDFGIARLAEQRSTLTQAGVTLGTASYLAPEQIRGESIDFRTDLFSFGVLAYELLTYEKPFRAQEISALFFKLLNEDPAPVSSRTPGIPPELERIVARSLEKDRRRRWSSTTELLRSLESLETSAARRVRASQEAEPVEPTRAVTPEAPTRSLATTSHSADFDRTLGLDELELDVPPGAAGGRAQRGGRRDGRRSAWRAWAFGIGAAAVGATLALWFLRPSVPASPAARTTPAAAANPATVATPQAEARASRPSTPTAGGAAAATATSDEVAPDSAAATVPRETATAPGETSARAAVPTSQPAPPKRTKRGRLDLGAAWNPAMTVTVGGTRYRLDHDQSIELPPGPLRLVFALSTAEYSFTRELPLRLAPGQRIDVSVPIEKPGRLTVQQQIGTRPGIVRLDGAVRGRAPLRGLWLSPGEHFLEIFPIGPALDHPLLAEPVTVRSDFECIVTFDLDQIGQTLVRERPIGVSGSGTP